MDGYVGVSTRRQAANGPHPCGRPPRGIPLPESSNHAENGIHPGNWIYRRHSVQPKKKRSLMATSALEKFFQLRRQTLRILILFSMIIGAIQGTGLCQLALSRRSTPTYECRILLSLRMACVSVQGGACAALVRYWLWRRRGRQGHAIARFHKARPLNCRMHKAQPVPGFRVSLLCRPPESLHGPLVILSPPWPSAYLRPVSN